MVRLVGGAVTSALLVAGLVACSPGSAPDPAVDASKNVAVDPEEVIRHEAAPGTPISYGIEVPDGASQVGPLIRQRRVEVQQVIDDDSGRAEPEDTQTDEELDPETHDPAEPAPADYTTALLRVDDDPDEVMYNMLDEIQDALPDSGIDPDKWAEYCTVTNGFYTGCELEVSGKTEENEHISIELTVDPGQPKTKIAPAGSLLRPVMALTIELHPPPSEDDEDEDGDDGGPTDEPSPGHEPRDDRDKPGDKGDDGTRDRRPGPANGPRGETNRVAPVDDPTGDRRDDKRRPRDDAKRPPEGDGDGESRPEDDETPEDKDSGNVEPRWPNMERERPAEPGNWILTPAWELRRNTEVILSTSTPKMAMLAVNNGADADAIARRYIRAFADEATTPKIDEVEDRNERSITYTPRNDGTGPSVAVTAVATGRGNYIELLFEADRTPEATPKDERRDGAKSDRRKPGADRRHNKAANRTRSTTG